MTGYIYLASPYTHPNPEERQVRYRAALDCAAWMMKNRLWVFAPIVHCHEMAMHHGLPGDALYWRAYDDVMLESAASLCVLAVDGWRESEGVGHERRRAAELGKGSSFAVRRADGSYRFAPSPEDVS